MTVLYIDTYSWRDHYGDHPRDLMAVVCGECGALVPRTWNLDVLDPNPWQLHIDWHARIQAGA